MAGGVHLHGAAGGGPGAGRGHWLLPLLCHPQDHTVSGARTGSSSAHKGGLTKVQRYTVGAYL